jgi:hypothetical protein
MKGKTMARRKSIVATVAGLSSALALGCYDPKPIIVDGSSNIPPVDAVVDAMQAPNFAFLTSLRPDGAFEGLDGADRLCQAEASAHGLTDSFRAVLWTADQTPTQRFAGSRGWVDLAGRLVADQPSDFSISMLSMASTDAASVVVPQGQLVSTGYIAVATTTDYSCNGWTKKTGPMAVVFTHDVFDGLAGSTCDSPNRFLCAGVGRVRAIVPVQQAGRIAFVAPRILLTGGLGQADEHCRTDAMAAGLPGTFRAMLSSSRGAAATRFDPMGLPWRRVDGPRIADTVDDFFQLNWKQVALRDAKGRVPTDFYVDFGGASRLAMLGSPTIHCDNWTGRSGGVDAVLLTRDGDVRSNFVCGVATPILCLGE